MSLGHNYKKRLFYYLTGLIFFTTLSGCFGSKNKGGMIPEVSVVPVAMSAVGVYTTLTGRLEAAEKAEIRARTPGVIKAILFTEGSMVEKGQPLFQLEDTPIRAQVAQAEAQYTQAQYNFNKISPLLKSGAVSRADYDNALTTMQAAKAGLEAAKVNLSYANITAPIAGKIGRAYPTIGALVGQGDVTLLAVIQRENPLRINLNQSVNDFSQLQKYARANGTGIENLPFALILNDSSVYPYLGKILFIDAAVDAATGQVMLKGEIPNDNGILLPGMYAKAKIKIGELENIFPVPVTAVSPNEAGGLVTVVNKDGTYADKQINIVNSDEKYIYASKGIATGDLVVVEGKIKLMLKPAKVTYKILPALVSNDPLQQAAGSSAAQDQEKPAAAVAPAEAQ